MVYALLDFRAGTLSFARSGHPYPLYVPQDGEPELWAVEGTLLGVFDTSYPVSEKRLRPGDKLLLYTDGMDGARLEGHLPGGPSLLACAARHRDLPVQELLAQLPRELFAQTEQSDDLTLLGLEMLPATQGKQGA
jgi:serine phosphatase RsbU (regulator of sigma subunit)